MTTHTIETISACEKRILVSVDAPTVKKATKAEMLKKAEKTGKLKYGGFRSHTAMTQNLLAQQMTKEDEHDMRQKDERAIHQKICNDSFSEVLSQEKIDYQGEPLIQDIQLHTDGSFSYVVLLETYPDISHIYWEKANIEKLETQTAQEDISSALPLLKGMGFDAILESKEVATKWCLWMIEIFQHQRLREQVIKELLNQNVINDLPQRVLEARYQEIKKEHASNSLDEEALRAKAREYIMADILFKACALEHNITIDRETLLVRIQQAQENPFIMSHVKDKELLPYYLAPRIFEEKVIEHLIANANSTTKTIPLQDFMALAFSNEKTEIEKQEKPAIEANEILAIENTIQKEDN